MPLDLVAQLPLSIGHAGQPGALIPFLQDVLAVPLHLSLPLLLGVLGILLEELWLSHLQLAHPLQLHLDRLLVLLTRGYNNVSDYMVSEKSFYKKVCRLQRVLWVCTGRK